MSVNKKRSRKGWFKITVFLIIFLFIYRFGLLQFLSLGFIIGQSENFHYNAISLSSVFAGFQFTGISILLSVTDKPRIKRLWDYNYLDTLYRVSIIGIIFNVITIVIALFLITIEIHNKEFLSKIIYYEILTIFMGLSFFMWSIKELVFVIQRSKEE